MAFIFKNTHVKTIYQRAFANCGVYEVKFDESPIELIHNDYYDDVNSGVFAKCPTLHKVSLKNCIAFTGFERNGTFYNCQDLESVDFTGCTNLARIDGRTFEGSGLITIDLSPCKALTYLGIQAFQDCKSLVNFKCTEIPGDFYVGTLYDNGILQGCISLESIDMHDCVGLTGLTSAFAMNDTLLKEVNLSGCTSIQRDTNDDSTSRNAQAFKGCTKLEQIDMTNVGSITPDNRFSIACKMFSGCSSLSTIIGWDTCAEYIIGIAEEAFINCAALDIDISKCANLEYIGSAQYNATVEGNACYGCASLTTELKNLPNLRVIAGSCFRNCTSLGDVDLSNNTSLEAIGSWSFAGCGSENIILDNCITLNKIYSQAFYGCNAKVIHMNNCTALQEINNGAFQQCSKLESFHAKNCTSLTSIGSTLFNSCSKLQEALFNGCSSLTSTGTNVFSWGGDNCAIDFTGCSLTQLNQQLIYNFKVKYARFKGNPIETLNSNCFRENTLTNEFTTVDPDESAIGSIIIKDLPNLTQINDYAFYGNNTYIKLIINNCPNLAKIDTRAFDNARKMTYFDIDTTSTQNITYIGSFAFAASGVDAKNTIEHKAIVVLPQIQEMKINAFRESFVVDTLDFHGSPLVILDDSVGQSSGIEHVNGDNCSSLEEIHQYAFYYAELCRDISFKNCTELQTIGEKSFEATASMENASFSNCSKLKTIKPRAFTLLGYNATYVGCTWDWTGCPIERVENCAFANRGKDITLEFPDSKINFVGQGAFTYLGNLQLFSIKLDEDSQPEVEAEDYWTMFLNGAGLESVDKPLDVKIYGTIPLRFTTRAPRPSVESNTNDYKITSQAKTVATTYHFPAAAKDNYIAVAQDIANNDGYFNVTNYGTVIFPKMLDWWCNVDGELITLTDPDDIMTTTSSVEIMYDANNHPWIQIAWDL